MKLYSYEDIASLISENNELKKYSEKLTQTNVKLQEELDNTKDKLQHLEQIVSFSNSSLAVGTSEEELCKIEINRLYQAAKAAPLEFNQVKAFEIYVKSLMLIRGKSVEDPKAKKSQKIKLDNEELLQLALQVVDDSSEQ